MEATVVFLLFLFGNGPGNDAHDGCGLRAGEGLLGLLLAFLLRLQLGLVHTLLLLLLLGLGLLLLAQDVGEERGGEVALVFHLVLRHPEALPL